MNFSELKQELADRGYSYMDDSRLGRYVNWARAELDEHVEWPYREAYAIGAAPLTVADLGTVEAVVNTTTDGRLVRMDYNNLLEYYGDLSVTGSPVYWYRATPGGVPTIGTFPVGDSIGVQYWNITPDLTGTQTPASPARYHGLIVDIAVRRAAMDESDFQAVQVLGNEIDRALGAMRNALLVDQGPAWVGMAGDDC